MTYRITASDDMGPQCALPIEPTKPLTDPESTIDDWELVSTTWQPTITDQTHHTPTATFACYGRLIWTWKAIYSEPRPVADRTP